MTTASKITLVRVFMIPAYLLTMYLSQGQANVWMYLSLAIFIVASLTDFLDGYIARHYNQTTDFGKFLVVQGAMLTEKDFSLCQYAGYYGPGSQVFASAVEAVSARAKMGAFIVSPHEDIRSLLQKEYVRK